MVRALIVACGILAYGKFARLSDHLGPTQSLRDVWDQHDLSAWTIYLFSASAIYVGLYPRTSPIIMGGARTARLDRGLHAVRRCLCLRDYAERSLWNLSSAGCTTFIGLLSDISLFCALQPGDMIDRNKRSPITKCASERDPLSPVRDDEPCRGTPILLITIAPWIGARGALAPARGAGHILSLYTKPERACLIIVNQSHQVSGLPMLRQRYYAPFEFRRWYGGGRYGHRTW